MKDGLWDETILILDEINKKKTKKNLFYFLRKKFSNKHLSLLLFGLFPVSDA